MSGRESLIEIDMEEELRKIIQQLNSLPDQIASPKILKNAINSTARKVRKQIVKDAQGEYALSDPEIMKDESQGAPKVLTATTANMSAAIRSRGPMQEIMAFMTRPNQGTGAAAAQVLASSGMKSLEMGGLKAFVTKFASGHVAIVQRRGEARLPIKKLLSPAVPHMLGNEAVQAKAEAMAYETLQAEIQKRVDKVLGRG